jgi:hypothetical protein
MYKGGLALLVFSRQVVDLLVVGLIDLTVDEFRSSCWRSWMIGV